MLHLSDPSHNPFRKQIRPGLVHMLGIVEITFAQAHAVLGIIPKRDRILFGDLPVKRQDLFGVGNEIEMHSLAIKWRKDHYQRYTLFLCLFYELFE